MSALGQKQTLGMVRLMSALLPKADIADRDCNVRFVPEADIQHASRTDILFRVWTFALARAWHGRPIKEGQGKGCRDV
jgi:hypothetical protein